MVESREDTLSLSIAERLKEELDTILKDSDYTRLIDAADSLLGEDDDEVGELYALVADDIEKQLKDEEDEDEDMDDLDDEFDDEDDEEEEDDEEDEDEQY